MSHFVAYILQFQEIIVYKIPPGGGGGSIASLRSTTELVPNEVAHVTITAYGSSNWIFARGSLAGGLSNWVHI